MYLKLNQFILFLFNLSIFVCDITRPDIIMWSPTKKLGLIIIFFYLIQKQQDRDLWTKSLSTKLWVRSAIICSIMTEEIVAFIGEWSLSYFIFFIYWSFTFSPILLSGGVNHLHDVNQFKDWSIVIVLNIPISSYQPF